jgi:hypothetical protein
LTFLQLVASGWEIKTLRVQKIDLKME